MELITLTNVSKFFGAQHVLRDISLGIHSHKKIGVIGINGAGKSTLMKILAGMYEPDTGNRSSLKDIRVGIQTQEEAQLTNDSIIDEVINSQVEYLTLKERLDFYYKKIKEHADKPKELKAIMEQYETIEEQFQAIDGYTLEDRIEKILAGLGIDEEGESQRELSWFTPTKQLSGGQRKIVELAKLLVKKFDVLILDEPTNHLDLAAREWLEDFIKTYEGTIILVSHDRYILNECVEEIIEVEDHQIYYWKGSYDQYKNQKKKAIELQIRNYRNDQKEYDRLNKLLKTYQYKASYNDKFARLYHSLEKRIARFEKTMTPKPITQPVLDLNDLFVPKKSSEVPLQVKNISFAYANKVILENTGFILTKGEHVALLGPNGSGKTTLLRLILTAYYTQNDIEPPTSFGPISPSDGEIRISDSTKIGYYSQRHETLHEDKTVFNEIWTDAKIDKSEIQHILRLYLFNDSQFDTKIKDLSGGEKSRVQFIKIILRKPTLLILDEPTNHLDIRSQEVIEQTLKKFEGSILIISHERYFLDQVVHKVIELKEHTLIPHEGNYSDYLHKKSGQ